ncbi:MAG: Gfo/Idh/MocA family oxidoreductase [Candidatus Hydrogenedentes bacterium]|nr:Gfo/Idh/MocA family oxidoreductase [Candidatus Hydrogenedentota bacterium]
MNPLKLGLGGVGGFGRQHVAMAETLVAEGLVEIVAFAEPSDAPEAVGRLGAAGARRYADFHDMLAGESDLDLVCIASPIPCHVPMARAAFERGVHVYLEKPPAVRIQDLRELVALQERAGVFCCVGFQDIARPMVAALKRALCGGEVGRIRSIRAEARSQRTAAYYARAPWAGRVRLGEDYVLDGPMNNACAHVLNLAAYLAAPDLHEFARPLWVQGEVYRAEAAGKDAEDTNCLRGAMDSGVEVCVHLTQCASRHYPRSWTITGDGGTARLHDTDGVELPGRRIPPSQPETPETTLFRRLVEVILESDEPLLMPLAEAEGHLLLSNGAYESSGRIHTIPEAYTAQVDAGGGPAVVVNGLDEAMAECAAAGRLLSEAEVPWAVATEPFDLTAYEGFPARWSG